MTRSTTRCLCALLLMIIAGSAQAQSRMPNGGFHFRGALSTFLVGNSSFPLGVSGGTQSFLEGHITDGFDRNRNGFSGFVIVLTEDSQLAPLGTAAQKSFDKFYDTLLPLYMALDGPATRLAAFGAPLTLPLGKGIVKFSQTFADALNSNRRSALPGLK